jgi:hypothetical protein
VTKSGQAKEAAMNPDQARYEWTVLKMHWCPAIQGEAALLEKRVYPSTDLLGTETFRVVEQRCSHDIQCNLNEHVHCKWAGTGPFNDPFAES